MDKGRLWKFKFCMLLAAEEIMYKVLKKVSRLGKNEEMRERVLLCIGFPTKLHK